MSRIKILYAKVDVWLKLLAAGATLAAAIFAFGLWTGNVEQRLRGIEKRLVGIETKLERVLKGEPGQAGSPYVAQREGD